jgi:uncharacterized membrane protein YebE (DUF533 family)
LRSAGPRRTMPRSPPTPECDSMFNPERLLSQLLGDAVSGQLGGGRRRGRHGGGSLLGSLIGSGRGGMSTGAKVGVGVGLLGIAAAAFQHYSQPSDTTTPNPLAGAGMPPPPPMGSTPPPPPPPTAARGEQALLLVRAMVTAAHADGLIDAQEHAAILGRARDAGLDRDTLEALDAEIRAPLTLDQLAARTPPALRDEVYAAALIAITADTEAERTFLDSLAAALTLEAGTRRDIHAQLGVAGG